jgi:hypothetical protein
MVCVQGGIDPVSHIALSAIAPRSISSTQDLSCKGLCSLTCGNAACHAAAAANQFAVGRRVPGSVASAEMAGLLTV